MPQLPVDDDQGVERDGPPLHRMGVWPADPRPRGSRGPRRREGWARRRGWRRCAGRGWSCRAPSGAWTVTMQLQAGHRHAAPCGRHDRAGAAHVARDAAGRARADRGSAARLRRWAAAGWSWCGADRSSAAGSAPTTRRWPARTFRPAAAAGCRRWTSRTRSRVWRELGMTAGGELLSNEALIAIHWLHRVGARDLAAYLVLFASRLGARGRCAVPRPSARADCRAVHHGHV